MLVYQRVDFGISWKWRGSAPDPCLCIGDSVQLEHGMPTTCGRCMALEKSGQVGSPTPWLWFQAVSKGKKSPTFKIKIKALLGDWRTWLLYQSGRSWQHLSWDSHCTVHVSWQHGPFLVKFNRDLTVTWPCWFWWKISMSIKANLLVLNAGNFQEWSQSSLVMSSSHQPPATHPFPTLIPWLHDQHRPTALRLPAASARASTYRPSAARAPGHSWAQLSWDLWISASRWCNNNNNSIIIYHNI